MHSPAPGWHTANGATPDILPGHWGITMPASLGNTFQGLTGDYSGSWWERVCQPVPGCLKAGVEYKFTIDLVLLFYYQQNADTCMFPKFAIWGGNNCNHQAELLFDTIINNTSWKSVEFKFTPTQTWCYLTMGYNGQVINPKAICNSSSYNPYLGWTYCGIDNMSCIVSEKEIKKTDVTCNSSCDGTAQIKMYGGVAPYSYLWQPGGQTTDSISNLCAGKYYVTVTDSVGALFVDSVAIAQPPVIAITSTVTSTFCNRADGAISLSATGGVGNYHYSWSTNAIGSNQTGMSSGTYAVEVSDSALCKLISVYTITNTPGPQLTISGKSVSCYGGSDGMVWASTQGGTGVIDYSWLGTSEENDSLFFLQYGVYSVTVTDQVGCFDVDSFTVSEPLVLIATTSGASSLCAGDSIVIGSSATGGTAPFSYNWNNGACTNSVITIAPDSTQIVTLEVTDANGCIASALQSITVNALPVVTYTSDVSSGCPLLCSTFSISTSTQNLINTFWSFGDGGTSTLYTPMHCYTEPGVYSTTVSVKDINGCQSTSVIPNQITVYNSPNADFSLSSSVVSITNPIVEIKNTSTDASKWKWSIEGEGPDSVSWNMFKTFDDTGRICVLLVVENAHTCKDTTEQCLTITEDFGFYVPNSFTPNSDGINDLLNGAGIGIAEYQLWIYDRWGQMIYTTHKTNSPETAVPWNGRVNNVLENVQEDVYVWKVQLTDIFGKHHNYIGHVSVIR
ncbi:MAG: gliding motility-associated C-terminal domain-containing protein [Bacteroidetes bacterium]|nr:gliding motility-associated C-terminal domain-containing protein [Bacteroidota bacterium]